MDFDVGIIGSGFGGSLLAMVARRLGLSVIMLERDRHPRFAIGESSTPLANLLLEELADRYDLPAVRPLAKWGTWQRECPQVACGLKRGFTFLHHQPGQPWSGDGEHELLVAASPNDRVADTHWYRPDFDAHLVRAARELGALCREGVRVEGVSRSASGWMLSGAGSEGGWRLGVRWLVDASGPRGVLFREFALGEQPFDSFPTTCGVYGHFRDVRRWEALHPDLGRPPYPPDHAALHHVFAGGWIWVLRFNNGITSAGVAAVDDGTLRGAEPEAAWRTLLDRLPSVRDQFSNATPELPMRHAPRLAFRCRRAAGADWALLPSAAGVVDPLLSTGFALNLLGLGRLARALEEGTWSQEAALEYERQTLSELDATAQLVGALYACMGDFELFAGLTKLYFAAVTFTETQRRLGHPERAGDSFLLGDNERFRLGCEACCRAARQLAGEPDPKARQRLLREIGTLIEPLDVAGLGRRPPRRHYPARPGDLLAAADKLGATTVEIRAMLERCGLEVLDHGEETPARGT